MSEVETVVIYHGGCTDGFCAAFLLWQKFPAATFIRAKYGDAPPDVTGKIVYIVDFSYSRQILQDMHATAEFLVVLDHHKTARLELDGLPYCIFDMTKSGAMLTWEYLEKLNGNTIVREAPWFVQYVQDRDLWLWRLPESKAVSAGLRSLPMDFERWQKIALADSFRDLVEDGEAILRDQELTVRAKVEQSALVTVELGSLSGQWRQCNATTLISETAGELAKETGIGCCWFERTDGARVYSLRSTVESGIDVSAIAKTFGGGGHKHAAGFTLAPECGHPWHKPKTWRYPTTIAQPEFLKLADHDQFIEFTLTLPGGDIAEVRMMRRDPDLEERMEAAKQSIG
jgi:hypothetical protein